MRPSTAATVEKKPKLNVRLLRRIQKHILEEPRRFQMGAAVITSDNQAKWKRIALALAPDASKTMPPCGTAACIAGWADILTGGDATGWTARLDAAEKLGIDAGDCWLDHPLFYDGNWPEPFRTQYRKAKTPKRRATIAAERIEHFIKTKGAE